MVFFPPSCVSKIKPDRQALLQGFAYVMDQGVGAMASGIPSQKQVKLLLAALCHMVRFASPMFARAMSVVLARTSLDDEAN